MLRGEITCRVPDEYDWSRFGTGGAIFELNEVISRLVEIPLPSRPRSSIVLGSVRAGTSFNRVATNAVLRSLGRRQALSVPKERSRLRSPWSTGNWRTYFHSPQFTHTNRREDIAPVSILIGSLRPSNRQCLLLVDCGLMRHKGIA